jgi:hypothetical protein
MGPFPRSAAFAAAFVFVSNAYALGAQVSARCLEGKGWDAPCAFNRMAGQCLSRGEYLLL